MPYDTSQDLAGYVLDIATSDEVLVVVICEVVPRVHLVDSGEVLGWVGAGRGAADAGLDVFNVDIVLLKNLRGKDDELE